MSPPVNYFTLGYASVSVCVSQNMPFLVNATLPTILTRSFETLQVSLTRSEGVHESQL